MRGFDLCVKNKGEIKTESLSKNRYVRTCILDGKTFSDEVRVRKHPKRPKRKSG